MKSFFFFFKFHSCDIKLMKYHIQYIYIYTMHSFKITIHPDKNKLIQKFFLSVHQCARECVNGMRFCAFSTENTRMALNRGNERLPCLQAKIRSGNGRPVFSRSGIVRSRARFTQLTNHYGAWNLCICYVVRWKMNVFRERC